MTCLYGVGLKKSPLAPLGAGRELASPSGARRRRSRMVKRNGTACSITRGSLAGLAVLLRPPLLQPLLEVEVVVAFGADIDAIGAPNQGIRRHFA